jgi:hypothetical protein
MIEIENTILQLKRSPLFYLFVSSRELFHSNFWYWLSTLNPQATINLFSDNNDEGDNLTFLREYNQRNGKIKSKVDLYITNSKNINIVIENKVKDLPKMEQLDRIRESFAKVSSKFVLATLFHCDDITYDGWEVITYKTIAEKINPIDFTENDYYRNLISDYKELTRNLVNLTELLSVTQNYDFAISRNKDLYNILNEIKLWEGYQKLRASHLITKYRETMDIEMYVGYDINNQKATLNFVLGLKDNYIIGIQIEDNQFRKFINGKKHIEFAESLRTNNLFFDSKWRSPRKKTMLGYNPAFQYQYEKIEILSFENLFNKVDNEIQNIISLREEIESRIPAANVVYE